QVLVDEMVDALWRSRRARVLEVEIFASLRAQIERQEARKKARSAPRSFTFNIARPDGAKPIAASSDVQPHAGAAQEAGRYEPESPDTAQPRASGDTSVPSLGHAFLMGSKHDPFPNLLRYRTAFERTYYRALHELERAQRARRGEMVPPPVALDVTLNG